jgi:replication factor C small subunit
MTDVSAIIWTEKYRPKSFDEVHGQHDIVSKVRAFVEQRNLPHLMFTGPAGTGKTSLSLVVAKTLFGDAWRENFLELNASDERGIDVVRVKVKDFARTRAIGDVPFKIIYLDECDALTKEAQQALRRTMENFTQTCRFILSANFSSKIIDPIQSRCAIFRFKPLPDADLKSMAASISKKEGISITDEALDALVEVAGGDCRRLANLLQSASALGDKVTPEVVFTLSSHARPQDIQKILELAIAGKFHESRSLLLDVMLKYGMSGLDVIKQLQPAVWKLAIPDRAKVLLIDKCGEIEFRMVEGADEYVQLEALLAYVTMAKQS